LTIEALSFAFQAQKSNVEVFYRNDEAQNLNVEVKTLNLRVKSLDVMV
jgi:hypothetical protein